MHENQKRLSITHVPLPVLEVIYDSASNSACNYIVKFWDGLWWKTRKDFGVSGHRVIEVFSWYFLECLPSTTKHPGCPLAPRKSKTGTSKIKAQNASRCRLMLIVADTN